MLKKNIFVLLFLVIQLFFVVASAETTGNLNISTATGLWGQTITTTSTTTTTTVATTSDGLTTTTTIGLTTTTTITTTTTTTITTTTTTIPSETYSEIINVTEIDIENVINDLRYEIKELIGRFDINKMIRVSKTISKNIIVERDLTITGNTSILLTNIKYNGTRPLKNFIVLDNISKSFAQNASEMEIIPDENKRVIEEDPVIAFVYSNLTSNDTVFIKYMVNKGVDSSVLNETKIIVFAEDFVRPRFPWLIIIVAIIIAILLIFFYYLFFRKPSKRVYGRRRKSIVAQAKEKIKQIKEKLKRLLKIEEEVKFRYEYKP